MRAFALSRTKSVALAGCGASIAAACLLASGASPVTAAPAATPNTQGYSALTNVTAKGNGLVAASSLVRGAAERNPWLGLRPDAARAIAINDAPPGREGATYALVPSATAPCLYIRTQTTEEMGCGADTGPTVAANYTGAIGVVPDSVETVDFTMTDGTHQTGEVDGNIWVSPPEADSVAVTIDGAVETVELTPRSELPDSLDVKSLTAESLDR